MKFCDRLRMLIEEKDLTQKQVAIELHIAVSTMGGYVQGTSEPDFETLKLIAEYFNVSTDYLLNVRDIKANTINENEMLHTFRSLTASQQKILLEQAKAVAKLNFKEKTKSS